jgi:hypothetical protein
MDSRIFQRFEYNKIPIAEFFFRQFQNTQGIEPPMFLIKKTRFLYCPRCGLRMLASEIFGYYAGNCPACGCKMIEEGILPYIPKKSNSKMNPVLTGINVCINKKVILW